MVLSSEFAALATLQNIVSAKKSFKDVVDDFIEFTIIYHHYKECDSAQIAKDLRSDFNFEIPISVIRNVLRSLNNKKFLTLTKNGYISSFTEEEKTKMAEYISQYEKEVAESDSIYSELVQYVKTVLGEEETKDGHVQKVFRSYLLGINEFNNRDTNLVKIIGTYILKKTKDTPKFIEIIEKIKSSTIIREGLIYQSDLLTEKFSNLTIYLDMEVLFDAYGINGCSYQKSFNEFFDLVKSLNNKGSKITLKYFDITANQIENYFHKALQIYDNRSFIVAETTAMQSIIYDNVNDRSDIVNKLADFKSCIENLGIQKQDTYSLENSAKNVKINEIGASTIEDEKDELEYRGGKTLKPLCLVKAQRNNIDKEKITDIRYVFASRTRYYLINAKKDIKKGFIPIALEVDDLINKLWLANSDGLKELYSVPTNTVTFVQRILSYEKRKEIIKAYEELKENKNLDIEKVKTRIIALRTFSSLPENMSEDSFNKSIDKQIEEMIHSKESFELQKQRTTQIESGLSKIIESKKLDLFNARNHKDKVIRKAKSFSKVFRWFYKSITIIGICILFFIISDYLRKTWNDGGEWCAWLIETGISIFFDIIVVILCIKIKPLSRIISFIDESIEKVIIRVFCVFAGIKESKFKKIEEEILELEKTIE